MSPDEFQRAWKSESSKTRVTVNADLLLKAVRRSRQESRVAISFNDFGVMGISLVLLPLWIYLGVATGSPWSWWLMVPAIMWGVGFVVVVRMRRKPALRDSGKPLLDSVKDSLALVEHQIWFQRNCIWWYHLPMALAMAAFFVHVSWLKSDNRGEILGSASALCFFVLALYSFIYFVDLLVVRKRQEPKRQELLALLTRLGDETGSEASDEYPMLLGATSVYSRRRTMIASLCAAALLFVGVGGIFLFAGREQDFPKKSPFAAVRWEAAQPEVKVGDEWHRLISLDGIPASEIVAFCRKTYGDKWRKRFEEDLVEVLAQMGHQPKDSVTLVVLPFGSTTPRTLEDVPMTEANRRAIRNLNQDRERREQREETHNSISIEEADAVIEELIPRLREEKKLVGLAAMVMVDGQVIASAVDGERKKGSGVRLEIGDRWHLGSITKSITATMIARLIEAGRMQWSTTIGECFPDATIHEDWKPVTIRHLLTHTAGAPANFSFLTPRNRPPRGPERTRARQDAALKVLARKPAYPSGEKMVYSNAGYTIAGAMVEKTTGETWEDLVQREVFAPLELQSAGFGPPKSPNKTFEQPRGHSSILGWKVAAGDEDDNTPIIGPAGIVHMTLSDLCTYATEHLRGEHGEGKLLSSETYKFLHTPDLDNYACGWVLYGPTGTIPHAYYWHNGSNTMWYALVAIIPEKKMAVAVTSNDGDIVKAEAAAWEVVTTSARRIEVGGEQ
ncbi:MAG: hypothetical protein AMXMBFR4_00720 [Candidatus Hydrogenedentota bacterium]